MVRQWADHNNINILPWPAKSPDLNPIENVWGFVVKKMNQRDFRPANREQLWEAIQTAWEELENGYDMRHLIMSMPRRLESVVAANGSAIKY